MVDGLAALIREQSDLVVVGVALTMAEALERVEATHPDVVLMDSWLPDGSGAEAAQRIRREHADIAVVFLSADVSDAAMSLAVEAGACGYVSKAACAEQLLDAVRRAAEGEFLVPPHTIARLLQFRRESTQMRQASERIAMSLTEREREVLRLMAKGLDNFRVAEQLGIGYGTVRSHVRGVLEKLGAQSRLEAVATARRNGLINGD